MSPRHEFHFPLVDLSIVLALLVVGWGAFQLGRIEPRISKTEGDARALQEAFKECQRLLREGDQNLEFARRAIDLSWYDALAVKAEYVDLAEHLKAELPRLRLALTNLSTRKSSGEFPADASSLTNWVEQEGERVSIERLEARSRELSEKMARAGFGATNGSPRLGADLGTLLRQVGQTYQDYLSHLRGVVDNLGKPLVGGVVAERLNHAGQDLDRLADLANQAQRDGGAIGQFLENQARSDSTRKRYRQEQLLQAFAESDSPSDLIRQVRPGSAAATKDANSSKEVRRLRKTKYALMGGALVLVLCLVADVYWRTAVLPLRNERAERRSANEQQKKLARFEELAAALAHEIRNPLTTISALNHTIQRKLSEGTAEHRDAVGIRREIDHINEILKDFIHLARPSAPNLTLMTAESLLKEVRDLMQPQLQGDAIRLDCEIKGQALFYGDRQQLKQVLTNLIRNAAESIHHGGDIRIRTSDATIPFKGKMAKVARIEVEDNGPGIRPEVQARLFEPFFSTKKEGTGLGLPISARIVDSHGGKLDFETQPGRATIFRVVLPAHEERE